MRILQVAPLWERVPPPAYGGTEAVVGLLTDALVRLGHDVTLRASGDSLTLAELRSVYPRSLRSAGDVKDAFHCELVHVAEALRDSRGFDLIHNHAGDPAVALAGLTDVPMLTTMHCLVAPEARAVWENYQGFFNTISWAQVRTFPPFEGPRFAGVVRNAIDVASFPCRTDKEDYLLFLSRLSPEKGAHLAIEVARKLDRRLVIAGKVERLDGQYFHSMVEPEIDGKQIVFFGEANAQEKRELYSKASCLVLPISWEEPFGLVMTEAMACGTPVVAFARGAAPEIIVDGQTGYLVDDVDSMVDAVQDIGRIDPLCCRRHVEHHFDVHVMAEGYLALYETILAGAWGTPTVSEPVLELATILKDQTESVRGR